MSTRRTAQAPPAPGAAPAGGSLRGELIRGSAWMVAMRWSMRFAGLFSTIVLARVLTPDDFGLVAMAMLVVLLLTVLGDVGIDLALIRHPDPRPAHYDTAWTYQILLAIAIAGGLILLAPLAGRFFDDWRVTQVLPVMALSVLVRGFVNTYTAAFRRDLQFGRDFWLNVVPRLISVVATIALALWWRSYWAMVVGVLTLNVASVVASYAMCRARPRISLAASAELWSFSAWVLLRSVAIYLQQRLDQGVVGRVATTGALGAYYMAAELASLLGSDLIQPIGRALMPGYVRLRDSLSALADAFGRVLGATAAVALLFGAGLALHAEAVVRILLGEQWTQSGSLLVILSLEATTQGLGAAIGPLMTALDRVRFMAAVRWAQLLLFGVAIAAIYSHASLTAIALAKLAVSALTLPVVMFAAARALDCSAFALLARLIRPALATLAMTAAVLALRPVLAPAGAAGLLGSVAVAGTVFAATLGLTWWLAGRPDGVEQELVRRLLPLLRRRDA